MTDPLAAKLRRYTATIWDITEDWPDIELSAPDRRRIGGTLFMGAARLVVATAKGMLGAPLLFADAPGVPAALLGQQERADAYEALADHYGALQRRAYDCYLYEQSSALRGAWGILDEVREEILRPRRGQCMPRSFLRWLALEVAFLILDEVAERREKARRKGGGERRSGRWSAEEGRLALRRRIAELASEVPRRWWRVYRNEAEPPREAPASAP